MRSRVIRRTTLAITHTTLTRNLTYDYPLTSEHVSRSGYHSHMHMTLPRKPATREKRHLKSKTASVVPSP